MDDRVGQRRRGHGQEHRRRHDLAAVAHGPADRPDGQDWRVDFWCERDAGVRADEADNDQGGTFRSDDGGESWTRTFTGRALQQRAWYYTHIHADPVDVDTVYALNVGAFKSTDGGKTFTGNAVQSHSDHHDMWINPLNNKAIVEGNDGGATVSLNGAPWTPQNNQPTAEIYRLAVDTRWRYWVYGGQQDNSTIAVPSVGSDTPYAVGGGESGHVAVDPRDYNIVYAGNYGGTMSRMDRKFRDPGAVRRRCSFIADELQRRCRPQPPLALRVRAERPRLRCRSSSQ